MSASITDRIRAACRAVSARAARVRIDIDRLAEYARELPTDQVAHPAHDAGCHYLGRGTGTLAFFIVLDAINFNSGYNPHLKKRAGRSGYFTIASALNQHFQRHGPLSAAALVRLNPDDCTRLFGQDLKHPVAAELMTCFAAALNALGALLLERYAGRFEALVAAADRSAERLMHLLLDMPFYRDVARYGDIEVPFLKRAQITAADLHLAFAGKGWGRFDDIDRLTMFADNLVPHVLRVDRVLRYDNALETRIDSGGLLPCGSPAEIEIRACGLHAVELLKAEFERSGQPVTARGLDFLLWHRGQQPRYKAIPRHRTRSVFY